MPFRIPRVLVVVRSPPKPREDHSWAEKVAPWREMLTLIVGGVWTLYLFVSIGFKQAKLDETQRELDIKVQTIDLQAKNVDLAKQTIDLDFERTEKSLSEDLSRLQIGEKQRANVFSSDHTYQIETSLGIARGRQRGTYVATLDFAVINTSQDRFEVSYVAIDYFIGKLRSSDAGVQSVPNPTAPAGDVIWSFVNYEAGGAAGSEFGLS
jgi:hypothetical protein